MLGLCIDFLIVTNKKYLTFYEDILIIHNEIIKDQYPIVFECNQNDSWLLT